jgi:hypothetical protein
MTLENAWRFSQLVEEIEEQIQRPEVTAGPPPSLPIIHFVKFGFWRANTQWLLALLLLAINIAFALVLVLPLYGVLDQSLSRSLMGERSLNAPDYDWLIGFLHANQGILKSLSRAIVWVGMGYMLLHSVLAAGVLEVLYAGDRFSLRLFFDGLIRHGWKFLRLFGLSLLVYSVIFWFFNGLLTDGVWFIGGLDRWTKDWASEAGVFFLYLFKNIILGASLLFAVMVFDYAKIKLVMERSRSVLVESLRAFRFVRTHLRSTLGIFYALSLVGVILMGIYLGIEALLPQSSLWWVLIAFLLQQLFMFSRMWLRVAFYGAEMEMYKQLSQ